MVKQIKEINLNYGGRKQGKTYATLLRSATEQITIACISQDQVDMYVKMAKDLNLNIPKPFLIKH